MGYMCIGYSTRALCLGSEDILWILGIVVVHNLNVYDIKKMFQVVRLKYNLMTKCKLNHPAFRCMPYSSIHKFKVKFKFNIRPKLPHTVKVSQRHQVHPFHTLWRRFPPFRRLFKGARI